MRLPAITVVLLLLVASTSQAASLGRDGRGQVLLFPFVVAEGGWDTFINLNLNPAESNIVKLRFLDGKDGKVYRSFNIYVREGDNWRAAVFMSENGPVLRIGQGDCTISDSGEFGGPGTEFSLDHSVSMVEAYALGQSWHRRSQGNVTCAQVAQRWQAGELWAVNSGSGLKPLTADWRNISGYFDLVKVEQGLSTSLPATAIRDFSNEIAHTAPDSSTLTLESADEGIGAIASLLLLPDRRIANDVITVAGIAASTDWIVSFPLQGYLESGRETVDIDGVERPCTAANFLDTGYTLDVYYFNPWGVWGDGAWVTTGESGIDPAIPDVFAAFLCFSVNTLTFGDGTPIFLPETAENGYRVRFLYDYPMSDASHVVQYYFSYYTSPVIAFRVSTFVNGTLNDGATLANYATSRAHKRE